MKNTIRFISPLFILFSCFAPNSFAVDEIIITAPAFVSDVVSNWAQPASPRGFDPMATNYTSGSYGATKKREAEEAAKKKRDCDNANLKLVANQALCKANAATSEVNLINKCSNIDYSITLNLSVELKVVSGDASVTISIPRSTNCRTDAHTVANAASLWCDAVKAEADVKINSDGAICDI